MDTVRLKLKKVQNKGKHKFTFRSAKPKRVKRCILTD